MANAASDLWFAFLAVPLSVLFLIPLRVGC